MAEEVLQQLPKEVPGKFVYLDYNASTPVDERVVEIMVPFLKNYYGNPSNCHAMATPAKMAIEKARSKVANCLGCSDTEVTFTSGGTEGANHAVLGTVCAAITRRKTACSRNSTNGESNVNDDPWIPHVITSTIEHPCVLEACRRLVELHGCEVTYIAPKDERGAIEAEAVKLAIRPASTVLITVMHANNETGCVQPINEIGAIARSFAIPFHTDAAQTVGKIRLNVDELNVDILSAAGHKFYAPKGVGALYIRRGTKVDNVLFGGCGSDYRRPGTENAMSIAALGRAFELCHEEFDGNCVQMRSMRDYLLQKLNDVIVTQHKIDMHVNGDLSECLPNTLNVSFLGVDAKKLVNIELREKVGLSACAACHSGDQDFVSNAIKSCLRSDELIRQYARGTVRFSVGKHTTKEEVDFAVQCIGDCIKTCLIDVR